MSKRTLILNLHDDIGHEVLLGVSVNIRRDQGKLIFFEVRDRTGKVQCVVLPSAPDCIEVAKEVRPEWVLRITGIVNKRPGKNIKEGDVNGDIEIEVKGIEVLAKARELPFELETEVNLDTYLDYLPLTMRRERTQSVFKVQAHILHAFRSYLNSQGFIEIQAPKLIGEDAEGGANSFNVEYFKHTAHLAQSPQFYKQITAGVFERVYSVGNVYRAEKHATTRHLNEYTSIDIEMSYIESHQDVMDMETGILRAVVEELKHYCAEDFRLWKATIPEVPEHIPALKLREAQAIIQKETGEDCLNEPDLEPAHERFLCEYAQKKYGSDFIFVTHFPMSKRPVYTYEDQEDPGYAKGFDLLFRGIEITTGGQRVHDYDVLVSAMEKKGFDPDKFSFYLQAFKYGMPPHGGFGMGLERLTAKFLGIDNVKEAAYFPRDINRIDKLLSQ